MSEQQAADNDDRCDSCGLPFAGHPGVIPTCAALLAAVAENREWLRIARLLDAATTDADESAAMGMLDDMRLGRSAISTPQPIVEGLLGELRMLRQGIADLAENTESYSVDRALRALLKPTPVDAGSKPVSEGGTDE